MSTTEHTWAFLCSMEPVNLSGDFCAPRVGGHVRQELLTSAMRLSAMPYWNAVSFTQTPYCYYLSADSFLMHKASGLATCPCFRCKNDQLRRHLHRSLPSLAPSASDTSMLFQCETNDHLRQQCARFRMNVNEVASLKSSVMIVPSLAEWTVLRQEPGAQSASKCHLEHR